MKKFHEKLAILVLLLFLPFIINAYSDKARIMILHLNIMGYLCTFGNRGACSYRVRIGINDKVRHDPRDNHPVFKSAKFT